MAAREDAIDFSTDAHAGVRGTSVSLPTTLRPVRNNEAVLRAPQLGLERVAALDDDAFSTDPHLGLVVLRCSSDKCITFAIWAAVRDVVGACN